MPEIQKQYVLTVRITKSGDSGGDVDALQDHVREIAEGFGAELFIQRSEHHKIIE